MGGGVGSAILVEVSYLAVIIATQTTRPTNPIMHPAELATAAPALLTP